MSDVSLVNELEKSLNCYAMSAVLDNDDLLRLIMWYIPPEDILDHVQFVRKSFHQASAYLIKEIMKTPSFRRFLHRPAEVFANDQKLLRRIVSNRCHLAGGFLLLGGSFSSQDTRSYWIRDNPNQFEAVAVPEWSYYDTFGSAAIVVDNRGGIRSFGGWSDVDAEDMGTQPTGYHIDLSFYQLADSYQNHTKQYRKLRHSILKNSSDEIGEIPHDNPSAARPSPHLSFQPGLSFPGPVSRCYSAASTSLDGRYAYVLGGCSSPYRAAHVYTSCLVADLDCTSFSYDEGDQMQTRIIGDMQVPRGGHSVVTMPNTGNLFVAGGYGGRMQYHKSVEMWDWAQQRWISLPDMHDNRSGLAMVVGTDNAIYVAGGSPDGSIGHKTVERFDPREGKYWHRLAEMHAPRGYISGAHGCNGIYGGHFYVTGGLHRGKFYGGLEYYDARRNAWSIVPGSCSVTHNDPAVVTNVSQVAQYPIDVHDFNSNSTNDSASLAPWFHGKPMPREGLLRAGFQMVYML